MSELGNGGPHHEHPGPNRSTTARSAEPKKSSGALVGGLSITATRWILRKVGATSVLTLLVVALVVRTPWVALERIETDTGTVHGYVVETPSRYLKVLTEPERELEILISSNVTSRTEIDPEW